MKQDINKLDSAKTKESVKGLYSIIETSDIGDGTEIWNYCHIRENVKIGKNCKIGDYVYIDKDVEIGDNVKIQNFCCIYKGVRIEDNCFLGPGVMFTNVRKPNAIHVVPLSAYTETFIRAGTNLGARTVIVCGADIEANIAAGCTVLGNQYIRRDNLKDPEMWIHGYPIKEYAKK